MTAPLTTAPEPLTPADCDLRDFSFMPLDIVRLFGSEFHARASDAEWRAGLTLWLKSYHQVPAGSLPDDDIALARLAEFGRDLRAWRKVKAGAMRGWRLCSDGRLYHPVVAEKVNEAWAGRLAYQQRQADFSNLQRERAYARWRRPGSPDGDANGNAAAMPRHPTGNAGDAAGAMPMKERGTGTGREKDKQQSGAAAPAAPPSSEEDLFWARLNGLGPKGISRSRCTQLLKLKDHDFGEANRVLDSAEAARNPSSYLGGVIRNLEAAAKPAGPSGANPNVPAWVNDRRLAGVVEDFPKTAPAVRAGALDEDAGEPSGVYPLGHAGVGAGRTRGFGRRL